jgi:hypothetical protein
VKIAIEPAKRAAALNHEGCRPLRGSYIGFRREPGACAPGFMLTPASQAKMKLQLLDLHLIKKFLIVNTSEQTTTVNQRLSILSS